MAKTITVLGATVQTDESHSVLISDISPFVGLDLVGQSAENVNALNIFLRLGLSNSGRSSVELFDKDDNMVVEVISKKYKPNTSGIVVRARLSNEAGAPGASSIHNPATGLLGHIIDEATFSTGRLEFTMHGGISNMELFGDIRQAASIPNFMKKRIDGPGGDALVVINFTVAEA